MPEALLDNHTALASWARRALCYFDAYLWRRLTLGRAGTTKEGPRTTLYWLADDTLHPFAQLPSGGDNSYPGFLELSPTHAVVSWYSTHEKDAKGNPITAIYMADLVIAEE